MTSLRLVSQEPKAPGGKPVSDQWLEPFVIVDKDDRPVGTVEVSACLRAPASHAQPLCLHRQARGLLMAAGARRRTATLWPSSTSAPTACWRSAARLSTRPLTSSTASGTRRRAPRLWRPRERPWLFAALRRVLPVPGQVRFAGLMQYDGEEKLPKHFLVPPPDIERTTGEYLARGCGVPTYACSESQKIGAPPPAPRPPALRSACPGSRRPACCSKYLMRACLAQGTSHSSGMGTGLQNLLFWWLALMLLAVHASRVLGDPLSSRALTLGGQHALRRGQPFNSLETWHEVHIWL